MLIVCLLIPLVFETSAYERPISHVKHDLVLERFKIVPLESPNYPKIPPGGTRITWNVTTDKLANILLICEDIRISPSLGCQRGYFQIFDGVNGEKYCGSRPGLTVLSSSNYLDVEFDTNSVQGLAKCELQTIGKNPGIREPEQKDIKEDHGSIKLELGGQAYDKIYFKGIPPETYMNWTFVTSKDAKISLYCNHILLGYTTKEGYLKTTGGVNDTEITGNRINTFVDMSIKNQLKVEVRTLTRKNGIVNCIVQAVNGKNPQQFKNLDYRSMDSEEFGVGQGVKKTNCDCGWSRRNLDRIVNGVEVDEGEYPWVVSITYRGKQWCGGSIITNYHILSAAHCVQGKKLNDFKIITGTRNITHTIHGQILDVKEIVAHEYNKSRLHVNDVAIFVLDEEIKFSDYVGPICLTKNKIPLINEFITIMGWGSLGQPGAWRSPTLMMKANVRVVDFTTCAFLWLRQMTSDRTDRVCAWAPDKSPCSGDSGGPAVWHDPELKRYVQVGIVSFGNSLCVFDKPTVNSEIAYHFNWIKNVIKDTKPATICLRPDE